MDVVMRNIHDSHREVLRQLFNTAYFILKEEMPFASFPSLLLLQKKNGSDLRKLDSYCNDQACRRLTPFLDEPIRDEILAEIADAPILSVLFDGATDVSVTEVEIIYVRIVKNGEVKEYFCGLGNLEHANAEGVFQAIDRCLQGCGVLDWRNKIVGAGSNGAKVNIGS